MTVAGDDTVELLVVVGTRPENIEPSSGLPRPPPRPGGKKPEPDDGSATASCARAAAIRHQSVLPVAAESRPVEVVVSRPSPSEPRPPNGSDDEVGNMADGGGNREKALDM